jgi:hypothetical protein
MTESIAEVTGEGDAMRRATDGGSKLVFKPGVVEQLFTRIRRKRCPDEQKESSGGDAIWHDGSGKKEGNSEFQPP